MLATEPVVRLRAATTRADAYSGNNVPDWGPAPTELTLSALVADAGTLEPLVADRAPVDADFTLYLEGDEVDVTAADRMRIRGLVCTVEGRPFAWLDAGTVVHCKIREG